MNHIYIVRDTERHRTGIIIPIELSLHVHDINVPKNEFKPFQNHFVDGQPKPAESYLPNFRR